MIYVVVLIVMLFCGIQAIRSERLMIATLWLAGVSALMATLLYGAGAYTAAVIELSVGAGLICVLLIFAISLAGDEPLPTRPVVPKPLAFVLIAAFALLFLAFAFPVITPTAVTAESTFTETFWHERSADALAQVVLIFTGALSVLGLLAERRAKPKPLMIPMQETPVREKQ